MTVAALAEDALILGERLAVLEPGDLGFGGGVNGAHHLGLVILPRVDESLLLLDRWGIWNQYINIVKPFIANII